MTGKRPPPSMHVRTEYSIHLHFYICLQVYMFRFLAVHEICKEAWNKSYPLWCNFAGESSRNGKLGKEHAARRHAARRNLGRLGALIPAVDATSLIGLQAIARRDQKRRTRGKRGRHQIVNPTKRQTTAWSIVTHDIGPMDAKNA